MKRRPIGVRLFEMVDKTDSCWLFTGRLTSCGYGTIREGGRDSRRVMAHRVSYELHVGPIPDGLVIDHLCRVRNCVNPNHLEPVTSRINVLRGLAPAAINARLTHCKKAGHPLTPDNLNGDTPGHRRCKKCRSDYEKARGPIRYAARKAARQAARAA